MTSDECANPRGVSALRDNQRSDTTADVAKVLTRWTLGDVVRRLREDRGWTREQLAERAGVHRTALGRLERDSDKSDRKTIENVAIALEVKVSEMLDYVDRLALFYDLLSLERPRLTTVEDLIRRQRAAQDLTQDAGAAPDPPS